MLHNLPTAMERMGPYFVWEKNFLVGLPIQWQKPLSHFPYWKASATRIWKKQPWNPIMMEWDVALYPDHQSVRQNEDQLHPYDPDFIKNPIVFR